jgi:hypothetical protein
MRVQFLVAAVALLLAVVAAFEQEKWNSITVASGKNSDVTVTVLKPGHPVVVHPFIPPQAKKFNRTKSTPGRSCKTNSDCESCISTHYCLWTDDHKCVRASKPASRALVWQGKASNACVSTDAVFKQTIIKRKLHELTRAVQTHPLPTTVADALKNPAAVMPINYGGVPLYINNEVRLDVPQPPPAPVLPAGFDASHLITAKTKQFTSNATAMAKPAPAPAASKAIEFVKTGAEVKKAAANVTF